MSRLNWLLAVANGGVVLWDLYDLVFYHPDPHLIIDASSLVFGLLVLFNYVLRPESRG